MKKIGNIVFGGLSHKIFNMGVVLVLTAIIAFAILGIIQLRNLSEMTEETQQSQTKTVKKVSADNMQQITENSLKTTAAYSADGIDWEFWLLSHDFDNLANQCKDVFINPDHYSQLPVSRPDKKNKGKISPQLMLPDGMDEPDAESVATLSRMMNLFPLMKGLVDYEDSYCMDCIIALPNGVSLVVDEMSDQKYEEDGSIRAYDPRERDWYKGAVKTKKMYYTPPIHSYFYNVTEVVFGVPVYVDGKLVAVIEGAMNLESLREIVDDLIVGEEGFGVVMDDRGQIIFSPRKEGELAAPKVSKDDAQYVNLFMSDNTKLKSIAERTIITDLKMGSTLFDEVKIDGEDYYIASAPMETIGWSEFLLVPKKELQKPTNALLDELDKVTSKSFERYEKSFRRSSWITLYVMIFLILNALVVSLGFARRIVAPINQMTKRVAALNGDDMVFEIEDAYMTGDEVEVLAKAFGDLSERTREYVREIVEITAEKQRLGAELSVATEIQASLLPREFPESHEFGIFASMTPAKEVGGDFYDFFPVDDNTLALVIADVSGKGVPAALFMVMAKTLIKNRTQMGGSPAQILADVDEQLSKDNEKELFVTVWLGLIDLTTGHMRFVSAGHDYPMYYEKEKDEYRYLKVTNSPAVALFPGMPFTEHEMDLKNGDRLFLYTDGLPEAVNPNDEQFGFDRALESVNTRKDLEDIKLFEGVWNEVVRFMDTEDQFDDLTVLSFTYKKKERNQT